MSATAHSREEIVAMAAMEYERQLHNEAVQKRGECQHCGAEPEPTDGLTSPLYTGAGGVMAGPFCDKQCLFGWLA